MKLNPFAQNLADFSLRDIPEEAIHEAKRCLITYLGSAISAHNEKPVRIIEEVANELGSTAQATIIGTNRKLDMRLAAMCNGTSGFMYDFDDTMVDTILHPSCAIYPSLLALGENFPLSGDKTLRCFVLGVEVAERLARSVSKKGHFDYGWHATGTTGMFGAAAAAAAALDLNALEKAYAIGLVGSQAAGNRANLSTDAKALHAGNAAANGLMCAMLARRGMDSSLSALESPRGFVRLYSSEPDYDVLNETWSGYQILKNNYKPYPCGVVNFPSIDAAIRIYRSGVRAADIERVEIEINYLAMDVCGHKQQPANFIEAKASVHHGVAMALLYGRAGLSEYTDEAVFDPPAVALRDKIHLIENRDIAIEESKLTVWLKNGDRRCEMVDRETSSVSSRMSDDTMEDKFRGMTERYLTRDRQNQLLSAVWNLDREDNIRKIIELSKSNLEDNNKF